MATTTDTRSNNQTTRIDAYSNLVKTLGLPTVLVGVGICIYVGWLPSPITAVKETLDVHEARAGVEHRQIIESHDKMTPILRQICRNTAKTEAAQTKCDWL